MFHSRLPTTFPLVGKMVIMLMTATIITATMATPAFAEEYSLDISILIQRSPTQRILSQQWSEVFSKHGFSARFRSGDRGETTKLEDVQTGRAKTVRIVGLLNDNGSVSFSRSISFRKDQGVPLKEWLTKLKKYGVGGPPEENVTWGLNATQYETVLKLFKEPMTENPDWKNPLRYLSSVNLPDKFQLTFTPKAERWLRNQLAADGMPAVTGLSKGSALAVGLSQFGLGFRPMPPEGSSDRFRLQIDVGGETSNLYPIGWKNNDPITVAIPAVSRRIAIDAVELPLTSLLDQVAAALKIKVIASQAALTAAKKNLEKITITRTSRDTPFGLLRTLGKKHDLGFSFRTDEAGTIFLWVTTAAEADAFRDRFRNVTPGR